MSLNRIAAIGLLSASLLWISACDTSTGSLISEDVKDLLAPPVSEVRSDIEPTTGDANPTNDPTTNPTAPPLVTSVSSTITIRGANIVLLIHGENLSDKLSVYLDNETSQCEVSELGNTRNGIVQTNLIEAACISRNISNRVLSVTDASGNPIAGSPVTFTGTSITMSTNASVPGSTSNFDSSMNSSALAKSLTSRRNPFAATTESIEIVSGSVQAILSAPTNLNAENFAGMINVSWDSVEHAQGYNVYVSNSSNPQAGVRGTTTYISHTPSIQISDFVISPSQFIVVTAFKDDTESSSSTELSLISKSTDISADGRFTVFLSRPNNASLAGDHTQVYLHDRDTDLVSVVSQSTSGNIANAESSSPKISSDGNVVVFVSTANNLDDQVVVADSLSNLYSRDLRSAQTQLLSTANLTAADNGALILEAQTR